MKNQAVALTLVMLALLQTSCASTKDQLAQKQSKQTLERIERERSHADWEQTKADSMSQSQSRSLQNMKPKDSGMGGARKDN